MCIYLQNVRNDLFIKWFIDIPLYTATSHRYKYIYICKCIYVFISICIYWNEKLLLQESNGYMFIVRKTKMSWEKAAYTTGNKWYCFLVFVWLIFYEPMMLKINSLSKSPEGPHYIHISLRKFIMFIHRCIVQCRRADFFFISLKTYIGLKTNIFCWRTRVPIFYKL